jgi:hypothetical protein
MKYDTRDNSHYTSFIQWQILVHFKQTEIVSVIIQTYLNNFVEKSPSFEYNVRSAGESRNTPPVVEPEGSDKKAKLVQLRHSKQIKMYI